jgi:hypothetical protein
MADKSPQSDRANAPRAKESKRGGYSSGATRADQLKPPVQGVKPADSNKPADSKK